MGALSQYMESGVIQHLFRTASFTKPVDLCVALCKNLAVASDTGALTGKETPNVGGYTRQGVKPLDANWADAGALGATSNLGTITFPVATADWGWISGVAICDSGAYGAGNHIFFGALNTPKLIGSGDQFKMNAGDVSFSVS